MITINNDWDNIFESEIKKDYFTSLQAFLDNEYSTKAIYPERDNIFTAFKLCSYENTKVIILGQDPYHNYHQAHGLAFSVLEGIELPPSLKNIYKEIESDIGLKMSNNGNLAKWASQGVLLLNTVLTVQDGKPNSHKNVGWESFTDYVIKTLCDNKDKLIFLLWGNDAYKKIPLISNNHVILTAAHPSPFSAYRGFFGCKHFSKVNDILKENNQPIIDWQI